jgi:putative ABC transport system permease protein
MMRVALKGIATRKLRAALTALAVVLGVALVSGTYVLTDTIDKAFGEIFTSSYERTDAVVTPRNAMAPAHGETAISAELLDRIRTLREVDAASGTLLDLAGGAYQVKLLDRRGRPIDNGSPTFGFGIDADAERFNPLDIVEGRWAAADGEVVVDVETAARYRYSIGDRIGVAGAGPAERFRIVGTARFGDVATIAGATIAVFDVATAQRLHDRDSFGAISVAAKDGLSDDRLIAAIRPLLPAAAQVRTGQEQAARDAQAASFVDFLRYFLLAFGGIALLVGAFVIVNTLSITVAQRTRELATLRMLGSSRRQVLGSVLLEGFVLGVVASVVGLGAGLVLAEGLSAVFAMLGLQLPEAERVFRTRTVIVSLAAGVGVTVAATLVPAVRATRVAPLAAVRDAQSAIRRQSRRTTAAATALVAAGAALLTWSSFGGGSPGVRVFAVVVGIAAAFVGTGILSPRLARPLVAVVGRPLMIVGGSAARLARENALRNPGRTAATAAALMIGLTLATFAAVFTEAVVASSAKAVRSQVRADYVVESSNGGRNRADVGHTLASAPGIETAGTIKTVGGGGSLGRGRMIDFTGVDAAVGRLYRFTWVDGSDAALAALGSRGAVVDAELARAERLAVGARVVIRTRAGRRVDAVVRGIFTRPRLNPLIGEVVVARRAFERALPESATSLTLVAASDAASVRRALRSYPEIAVRTPAEYAEARSGDLVSVLRLLYVLLGIAVLVSVFGMVNTLVLSVFERTREIGMLRALGMTRRQVRRMVRHEGILTAVIGGGLGIPLGIGAAAAVLRTVDDGRVAFSLPVGTLGAFVVATVALGFIAAILPARRASRLNAIDALQYE